MNFKIGDEVVRVGPEWRGIKPGAIGVVVAVTLGGVRVRYDSAISPHLPDGSFGQTPANLTLLRKPSTIDERAMVQARDWMLLPSQLFGDPCPLPKPPLGANIGMFIRDGMSPGAARIAIANRAIESKPQHLPKVRAALPGAKPPTVHRAPRQMGWLNVKLGISSDQHVLWGVAPVLDAFGRDT